MISFGSPAVRISAAALCGVFAACYGQARMSGAPQDAAKVTTASGVFTADQAKRGQTKYNQVCSNCHQSDLTGSDQAPALAGGDFLDRWEGQSVGDMADRIRTSMPQDDIGSLNTQMSVDLVAYLLQANNFPAGQEELKADRSFLKTVMIKKK